MVKNPPANAGDIETRVQSLGWEDPLEEEIATHSSILSWRIPWTEESIGLLSVGSQRVGHDRSNLAPSLLVQDRLLIEFRCLSDVHYRSHSSVGIEREVALNSFKSNSELHQLMNKNVSSRNHHVHMCFSKGFCMVILVVIAKSVAIFYQVTATGSCLSIAFWVTLTSKQELKTKHNSKLAISQKFVISFLFEGAANELQMDHYLQFPSVS